MNERLLSNLYIALEAVLANRLRSVLTALGIIFGVAAVIAMLASVFYSETLTGFHIFLMSAFFIPIALGNTLFGLLKMKASVYLGEISYSIYLVHGLILYVLFSLFNIGIGELSMLNALMYMPVLTLLVIITSTITFLMIERPFMQYSRNNNLWEKFTKRRS